MVHVLYLKIWVSFRKCQVVQCSTVIELVENYHLQAENELGLTFF